MRSMGVLLFRRSVRADERRRRAPRTSTARAPAKFPPITVREVEARRRGVWRAGFAPGAGAGGAAVSRLGAGDGGARLAGTAPATTSASTTWMTPLLTATSAWVTLAASAFSRPSAEPSTVIDAPPPVETGPRLPFSCSEVTRALTMCASMAFCRALRSVGRRRGPGPVGGGEHGKRDGVQPAAGGGVQAVEEAGELPTRAGWRRCCGRDQAEVLAGARGSPAVIGLAGAAAAGRMAWRHAGGGGAVGAGWARGRGGQGGTRRPSARSCGTSEIPSCRRCLAQAAPRPGRVTRPVLAVPARS